MKNLQENIVPAEGQNKGHSFVYGVTAPRILFLGNSITKHAEKPDIGWLRDCGMAASCLEKDYVHVYMNKIRQIAGGASFAIGQVAGFEREFSHKEPSAFFSDLMDYNPHLIIAFFGANVSADYKRDADGSVSFGEATARLIDALKGACEPEVFVSEGFYIRPELEVEKKQVCMQYGYSYISLGDIPHREETHGEFNHPNDLGMELIADVFFQATKDAILKL